MSVDNLLQILSGTLYVLVFVVVVRQLLIRPRRVLADTTLFFGASMVLVALSWLAPELGSGTQAWREMLSSSLLLSLPYLLTRLVDDFADVPRWIVVVATIGLPVVVVPIWLISAPRPVPLGLAQTLYFVALVLYAAVKFARESGHTRGVTRRRLQSAAVGSVGLGLVIFIAGAELLAPGVRPTLTALSQIASLTSGVGYFLAFAPPRALRWAWQEPELRALLERIGGLSRLPDTESTVTSLEEGIARSLGATAATIGLWDEWRGVLRFRMKRAPVIPEAELKATLSDSPGLGQHFRRGPDIRDASGRPDRRSGLRAESGDADHERAAGRPRQRRDLRGVRGARPARRADPNLAEAARDSRRLRASGAGLRRGRPRTHPAPRRAGGDRARESSPVRGGGEGPGARGGQPASKRTSSRPPLTTSGRR